MSWEGAASVRVDRDRRSGAAALAHAPRRNENSRSRRDETALSALLRDRPIKQLQINISIT